jgi:hypothetical protein
MYSPRDKITGKTTPGGVLALYSALSLSVGLPSPWRRFSCCLGRRACPLGPGAYVRVSVCAFSPSPPLSPSHVRPSSLSSSRRCITRDDTFSFSVQKPLLQFCYITTQKRVVLVPCCPDLSACKSSEPVRVIVRTGTVFQFDML